MAKHSVKASEQRALSVAMAGNIFMGAAGILAAVLSNSSAILMDGLFSLIAFTSALVGRRISTYVESAPDRVRPMGYAADESVFVTFRSLSLIGLILFACSSAVMNIASYMQGNPVPELNYGPMLIYFVVICATCFGLWAVHRRAWKKTGQTSGILKLEAKAALIDGSLTLGTAFGLGLIYVYGDSFLAPIAPIGDSIVVFFLCLFCVGQVWSELKGGIGELLGVTAKPEIVAKARRALRAAIADLPGEVTDISVVKLGRVHTVSVYYNPKQAITPEQIDTLNLEMIRDVRAVLPGADVLLCISQYPRSWPEGMLPA